MNKKDLAKLMKFAIDNDMDASLIETAILIGINYANDVDMRTYYGSIICDQLTELGRELGYY